MQAANGTPSVVAELDLHGYRLQESIRRFTQFIDEVVTTNTTSKSSGRKKFKSKDGNVWVLVITGSGAHGQDGPVLRNGIEKLMVKRGMTYRINRGKGSFMVLANSGVVLRAPQQQQPGTKIIVKPRHEIEDLHNMPDLPKPTALKQHAINPIPSEAAAHDQSIRASKEDFIRFENQRKKETKLLKKAMSMSNVEYEKQIHQCDQEEANLQRAMSLSQMETEQRGGNSHSNADDDDDDDVIKEILELSKKDVGLMQTSGWEDDEERLREVLELSMKDAELETEDDLAAVLELSKHDAMEHSGHAERDEDDSKDEALKQALAVSLQDL
uniref:Smr domain-containing protein n=1 Tax=Craspedostauros australis TaxID=1486917 RepID=A0A7R9WX99_9STRA|mmetsp:Transcript_301/g.824  ORF Transcript_301/g.824 Transcript_301/m.824 type:complete len:327 (+) Transcript_301:244-1224(+)|eukprot:CAMPEP_0198119984 /NCGR_PEP_ID=MMETSP1442-20131203/27612_1 /TAXON_ID= /ORGANISM="Craspedostauros australis, Strain CCMP3328" /LENGTH=326 /DNA_ID=CAMNT_0043778547 /DNA_START=220 /DNA_END=1200 /DNA_ORIENTATION=+